jgi:hypothetical protein
MKKDIQKPTGNAAVDAFLKKAALTPHQTPANASGRLIFAMDATLSREPTWDRALATQSEMFRVAADVGRLSVQLVYFRGFGEFKASPWVLNGDDLAQQMTGVRCRGGRTQIERVLEHALKEAKQNPVKAVVYIGDCVEEEGDALCEQAGRLGLVGAPAFVFQEGRDAVAEPIFREIARLSGGAYSRLTEMSADRLRDILGAVAAYAAGGADALDRFSRARGRDVKLLASQLSKAKKP